MTYNRRDFLKQLGGLAAGFGSASTGLSFITSPNNNIQTNAHTSANDVAAPPLFFTISLAQWSLHKKLWAKEMDNLDFPSVAKNTYGISVVEYVNQFFKDKAKDEKYLAELLKWCNDNGVKNHLIMCDGEGDMGSPDANVRNQAVENHYKWVDAAKYLGCATIRVNAFGQGSAEEVAKAAAESLS